MPISVATFNVKNLLAPATERDRAVLPDKLAFVAARLSECDADVIGLQEVGSAELVQRVVERMSGARGYEGYEAVVGPADARGIRCALLTRLPLLRARVHTAHALPFPAFVAGDPAPFGARIPLRRGVVHARVAAPELGPVDVLVVHFKSPRAVPERGPSGEDVTGTLAQASPRARAEGALRSLVWRAAESLHVRGLVDDVLASSAREGHTRAHVAVVGDMNDGPDSAVLRTLRSSGDGALFDCTSDVDIARRFSILHEGRKNQLDHVLATAGLLERLESARFLNEGLREHGPAGKGGKGDGDDDAMTVDSDHAAVVVRFR